MKASSQLRSRNGGNVSPTARTGLWTLIFQLIVVGGLFTALWSLLLVGLIDEGKGIAALQGPKRPLGGSKALLDLINGQWFNARPGARPVSSPRSTIQSASFEWPQKFEVYISPRPSASMEPESALDTRNCQCVENWRELAGTTQSLCKCGTTECPNRVNPRFITEAEGQDVCSLRRRTGYSCTLDCHGDEVRWYGKACGNPGQEECPALVATPSPTPTGSKTPRPPIVVPKMDWDPNEVYDLRGASCEMLDGKERCFTEDTQGRVLCPEFVTPRYLAFPEPGTVPMECYPQFAADQYCIVQCQPGNDIVRWWPHSVSWCYSSENFGNCPSRHPVTPKKQFTVKPWAPSPEPEFACQRAAKEGIPPRGPVPELTVGLLTHEPLSFARSMASYEKYGLFDVVSEFIIFINNRRPEVENVIEPYIRKYGSKIRVLGDGQNHGIARGMVALTNNASNPYFLFLERDFELIEPSTCVEEQLRAGIELVKRGEVHVVRYRHRRHAGRPNWAENFFRGHEEDAFSGRQPNLACNHHYWVWDVEKRWPEYFWTCGEHPQMICSDSYYCNWTNNPQLWSIEWWNRDYVSKFDSFKRNDPYWDLESYMNWEPGSWNDRKYTVAQGDGLFRHNDMTKF